MILTPKELLLVIADGESETIEFFNPGDLYDDLTIEQLESNNYKSKTRNKLIALMFKECGLIEKYGSGIGRIKKFCKAHNIIEPKFEEMQKGFQVTLYKATITEKKSSGGVNELLDYISKNKGLSAVAISQNIKIPLRTIQRKLKQQRSFFRKSEFYHNVLTLMGIVRF